MDRDISSPPYLRLEDADSQPGQPSPPHIPFMQPSMFAQQAAIQPQRAHAGPVGVAAHDSHQQPRHYLEAVGVLDGLHNPTPEQVVSRVAAMARWSQNGTPAKIDSAARALLQKLMVHDDAKVVDQHHVKAMADLFGVPSNWLPAARKLILDPANPCMNWVGPYAWLQPDLSRNEAERCCNNVGDFVVRVTRRKSPVQFVVTFVDDDGKKKNSVVCFNAETELYNFENNEETFKSVPLLIKSFPHIFIQATPAVSTVVAFEGSADEKNECFQATLADMRKEHVKDTAFGQQFREPRNVEGEGEWDPQFVGHSWPLPLQPIPVPVEAEVLRAVIRWCRSDGKRPIVLREDDDFINLKADLDWLEIPTGARPIHPLLADD
jgi:hypothetical protein